jgi:RHS repeat-associated protein
LADGLGSVRTELVSDTVETVTTYSPFGNLLAQTGSSGTVYGFTGEQHDSAAGLLFLRARYYNAYLNQFLSRDPFPGFARLPASQNGYSYSNNNPVNYTDLSGLCAEVGDEVCWSLAESAWLAGLGPLGYLGTLTEFELGLVLGGTRYFCTESHGCFDIEHVNPGRVDEVLSDIERYLNSKQLIDLRGGFGPADTGYVAYYSVSDPLPPDKIQGVALGILMDYELRWERLQGSLPFGPGAASSFAIEDLPSNYLGYIIGFNYCSEERNNAVFDLFELLGGAKPVENLPHPTKQVLWAEAHRIPKEVSAMNMHAMVLPITNREFSPLVNLEGEWQNIPWPEELQLTPIDSSSGLWRYERSGLCLLGVPAPWPWNVEDCGS